MISHPTLHMNLCNPLKKKKISWGGSYCYPSSADVEIETVRYLGIFCSPPTSRGGPEPRLGTSVTWTYLYILLPLNSQAYASAQMYPNFVEIFFLLLFLYYHLSNPGFTGATSNITLQVLYEISVFWFNKCYYNQAIFCCFQCSRTVF